MQPITNCTRDAQLLMHALGSAVGCASEGRTLELDLSAPREASPAAQRVRVLAQLDDVLAHLRAQMASKKEPPAAVPAATLGRRLVAYGERYDAVERTYTPGPGFEALLNGAVTDALTRTGATEQIGA